MIASGFSWFHLIPAVDHNELIGGLGHMDSVHVHAWLVVLLLLGFAWLARRGLEAARTRTGVERFTTDERLSPRVVAEAVVELWQDSMGRLMGPADVRIFLPLIASVFCYILVSNLLGVVPGLLPPTDNVSNNVGMAIASFLLFNAVGLWRDPVGYLKHLLGPVWWLIPLMLPVEILSLLIRPFALMVRLSANMYGDHQVFTKISDMVPWWLPGPVIPLIVLALMVSTVQAFVFSMLSTVYVGLAMPHHDHDDAHGHDAH